MPQIAVNVDQESPSSVAEGTNKTVRGSRYGEPFVYPACTPDKAVCSEGNYFFACNPTFDTGIAMGIQTTFSDTANILALIRNTASANGKSLYLDYIRLICTAAGASTTISELGITIDPNNRYSAGGTALTPVCGNSGLSTGTVADIRFGIVTALAAVSKRQLCRAKLKTQAAPCWTIGDQVLITFGETDSVAGSPTSGAATLVLPVSCGPVILGPGNNHSCLIHMWNKNNAATAPSWEVEFGWWER